MPKYCYRKHKLMKTNDSPWFLFLSFFLVMFSFSANIEIEMHWWIRQNVSKIIILEFSIK